jgi:hypothetical protein
MVEPVAGIPFRSCQSLMWCYEYNSVVPIEDVPMDPLSILLIGGAASSLMDPSLVNDKSIATVSSITDHSALSFVDPSLVSLTTVSSMTDHSVLLTGVAPLSLVDLSAVPSFVTKVNSMVDHSATSLSNITQNAQLSMMLTIVTLSVTSDMC